MGEGLWGAGELLSRERRGRGTVGNGNRADGVWGNRIGIIGYIGRNDLVTDWVAG
jgi:hypothetical protein